MALSKSAASGSNRRGRHDPPPPPHHPRDRRESRGGHIPSALSILDIVWHLYDKVLKIRFPVAGQDDPLRDRFILSKGHGCLALYAVLAEKGFFPPEWLDTFCKHDSPLRRPSRLPQGARRRSQHRIARPRPADRRRHGDGLRLQQNPARLYCLIGDGEANEGSIWEAITLAAHMKLGNLCVHCRRQRHEPAQSRESHR
jgi:transketolase